MTGRKFCTSPLHRGPRWLLCTEFHVKEWNEDKTEPRRLMSHCKCCQRVANRRYKGRKFPYQIERAKRAQIRRTLRERAKLEGRTKARKEVRNSKQRRAYRDRRDPRLPFDPFHEWLLARINESSVNAVAKTVGVSWKRVSNLRDGWEYKDGGWYSILHIRLSTVEMFTRSYGVPVTMIYDPYVIEHYRAELYTQRTNR